MEPTMNANRIHVIDSLRGFALLGLPFVNVLALWSGFMNLSGTTNDVWIQRFLYIFVEGRFFAIFSFLFGVGVWIFYSRAKERQDRPSILFIRRMFILFLIGVLHQWVHPGEALLFYSILGLPIFFLHKFPKLVNLLVGIIGVIIGSILGAKVLLILPLMILGFAFGQYRIFEAAEKNQKKWLAVMIVSLIATSIATIILWQKAPEIGSMAYMEHRELTDEQIEANIAFYDFAKQSLKLAPFYSIFYVSLLVLIVNRLKNAQGFLNAFGRMAFTNYIGQTVLLVGIGLWIPKEMILSYVTTMIICLVIVFVQMVFSYYWLKGFKYGPLEWLWRCGTYKKWLSIRRN